MKKYLLLIALAFSPMLYGAAAPAGEKIAYKTVSFTKGRKIQTRIIPSDRSLLTYLAMSSVDDSNDLVDVLSDPIHKATINDPDRRGDLALRLAASARHIKKTTVLLKNGATIENDKDKSGLSIFRVALISGHIEIGDLLIRYQPSIIFTRNPSGYTPLMEAVNVNNPAVVSLLLSKIPSSNLAEELAKVKIIGNTPHTALSIAKIYLEDPSMLSTKEIGIDEGLKNVQDIIRQLEEAQARASRLTASGHTSGSAAPAGMESAAPEFKRASGPKAEAEAQAQKAVDKKEAPKDPIAECDDFFAKFASSLRESLSRNSGGQVVSISTTTIDADELRSPEDLKKKIETAISSGPAGSSARSNSDELSDELNDVIAEIVRQKNYSKFQQLLDAGVKTNGDTFWHCMAIHAPYEDIKLWAEQEGLVAHNKLTDKGKCLSVRDLNGYLVTDLASIHSDFETLDWLLKIGAEDDGYTRLHFAAVRLNLKALNETIDALKKDKTDAEFESAINRLNDDKCNALQALVRLYAEKKQVHFDPLPAVEILLTHKSKLNSTSKFDVLSTCVVHGNFELLDHILNHCQDPFEILTVAPAASRLAEDMRAEHMRKVPVDRDEISRLSSCIEFLEKAIAKAKVAIATVVVASSRGTPNRPKAAADSREKSRRPEVSAEAKSKEGRVEAVKPAEMPKAPSKKEIEDAKGKQEAEAQAKKEAEILAAKRAKEEARKKRKAENRLAKERAAALAAGSAPAGTPAVHEARADKDKYVDLPTNEEKDRWRAALSHVMTTAAAGTVETKKEIGKAEQVNQRIKRLNGHISYVDSVLDRRNKRLAFVRKQLEDKSLSRDGRQALCNEEATLVEEIRRNEKLLGDCRARKARIEAAGIL